MRITFATKRPRRFLRWRTLIVGLVVVAIAVGAAAFVQRRVATPPLPTPETDAFLAAWGRGDTAAMAALVDSPPADFATGATSLVRSLPQTTATYRSTAVVRTKTGATATYHARVDLSGFGPVEWDGTLVWTRAKVDKSRVQVDHSRVQVDNSRVQVDHSRVQVDHSRVWRVHWVPDLLYPGLAAGQRVTASRTWPVRASILAADGAVLAGNSSFVTIGLEPDRVTQSLGQIKLLLQSHVGTDPATVDAALHAPGVQPTFFVPVATVPNDARYRTVLRPKLAPVPGVFFRRGEGVVASAGGLDHVIGRVGEITADRLKQLGAPYRAPDQVGMTGLQATFEKRLAGAPRAEVVVNAGSKVVRTVKRFPGRAAQSVRLTIDPKTQQAAEAALAGVTQPAALVAIDVATGRLRAVVSKPDGGFDRALEGRYPPGSTFKVVTAAALLANGGTASTFAPCPATITVGGRAFHNFEGEASGSLDLARAFAISCNNAFIGLGGKLPTGALGRGAASFGFNTDWTLPITSAGGSFPAPRDRTELAAAAIGQARVLASPAQMASVAAAVSAGRWRAPVLTIDPAPRVPSVRALTPKVVAALQSFMASVVQSGGTAAGAGLPAGVAGKTGTAEFGNADPPRTHAWFIGYRGNLAFAVIVEDGGVGGRVAAPLAASFLNALS